MDQTIEQNELTRLVRDSQAGAPQARERLVQSVQGYICFYCRTMIDDPDEVMDAAQNILVAMLTGLNRLEKPEAFRGWLRQIIIRTCGKQRRRMRWEQRRLRSLEELSEEEDVLSGLLPPEKLAEQEEVRQEVMKLVDALPPPQRLCVLLYYYDEMSVEEIASALHLPKGTVKSRLYYARQAIKRGAEESEREGFPLYGLSPLALLRYVFLQEAAGGLPDAAASGLTQTALAAGGAAAAAKTILGLAAAKKAAILAGVALAVAGSVLLAPERHAPEEPVQQVQMEEPAQPDEPPLQPAPAPQTSAAPPEIVEPQPVLAAEPAQPRPQIVFLAEPPVQPAPEPQGEPDLQPVPEEPAEPFSDIEKNPEPLSEPEETDGQEETDESRVSEPNESEPGEDPAPEPEHNQPLRAPGSYIPLGWTWPVVFTEPVNPAPGPAEPDVQVNEQVFDGYQGNGGYGFTSTFAAAWDGTLPPGELTYSSSDPAVAVINEKGEFTTLSKGTAVLSATQVTEDGRHIRYDLTVTVEDQFNWEYVLPDVTLLAGEEQACCFLIYGFNRLVGYEIRLEGTSWSSSDPDVAEILEIGQEKFCVLHAVAPGTAEITGTATFLLDTAGGEQATMEDTCSFQVTVEAAPDWDEIFPSNPTEPTEEEPAEPTGEEPSESTGEEPAESTEESTDPIPAEPVIFRKELTEFGINSGYGFQSDFAAEWGEVLPEGLAYVSSDESVVKISAETGEFYTVSAGTAELTAASDNPEKQYILTVHVRDCFQWSYTVEDLTLGVGERVEHGVSNCVFPENTWPVSGTWSRSDPLVIAISDNMFWQNTYIAGIHAGTTTVTDEITFELATFEGYVRMTDTVAFQVTVVADELELPAGQRE